MNNNTNKDKHERIITDAYREIKELRAQLEFYDLSLDDVGILYWNKRVELSYRIGTEPTDLKVIDEYNPGATVMLNYSVADGTYVSYSVSYVNLRTQNKMREAN